MAVRSSKPASFTPALVLILAAGCGSPSGSGPDPTVPPTTAHAPAPDFVPPVGPDGLPGVFGAVDGIDADGVASGWAIDPARAPASIDVAFFVDGPKGTGRLAGSATASVARADVSAATGYGGDHGFSWRVPDAFRDAASHDLYTYALASLLFYAAGDAALQHLSGYPTGGTWTTDVAQKPESYVTYGPYTKALGTGDYVARFELGIDNNSADDALVATVDVNDAAHDHVLARRDLTRTAFSAPDGATNVYLPFTAPSDAALEFRVVYHCCARLEHRSTAIFPASPSGAPPPPSTPLDAVGSGPLHFGLAAAHVDPMSVSIAQLRDLQGDLMLWVPAVKPTFVNGEDPVTHIRRVGSSGEIAHGIEAGWVWTLTIDRYPKAQRELIYQAALASGYTHFAVQVTGCALGGGYHGILPVTDCTGYDARLNSILHEVWDHHLIPLCTGVSPTDPAAAGLDKSLCRIVLSDWDNSDEADCHVKALADTFPSAQLVYELPSGAITPRPDACSPSPFPATGGDWIRKAQQKYPNFFAVAYEVNQPEGLDANAAQLGQTHAWWRDLQEIRFEIDTYWKFWDGRDPAAANAYNDALQQRVPWLRGFMSGGTAHAPSSGTSTSSGIVGELDLHSVTLEHMASGFADWPVTTHIKRLELRQTDVYVELDNGRPDSWPDTAARPGMGPLLYSLGLVELIDGVWYASAPIQTWRNRNQAGGAIQCQDIGDGRGQIRANWFYDPAWWGPLAAHQPRPGEIVGFFICAGDCRDGVGAYSPVKERSNVVLFPLPAPNETAVFTP